MNKKYKQVTFKTFKPEDKNKKIVYTIKSIPMPVYVVVTYEITIRTEYQQHLNQLLQPFQTFTGGINYFVIESEGSRYEVFMGENFEANNTVSDLGENERLFETKISLEVLGHLVGQGKNAIQPDVVERENIVDVKISREQTWVEPIDPKIKKLW